MEPFYDLIVEMIPSLDKIITTGGRILGLATIQYPVSVHKHTPTAIVREHADAEVLHFQTKYTIDTRPHELIKCSNVNNQEIHVCNIGGRLFFFFFSSATHRFLFSG